MVGLVFTLERTSTRLLIKRSRIPGRQSCARPLALKTSNNNATVKQTRDLNKTTEPPQRHKHHEHATSKSPSHVSAMRIPVPKRLSRRSNSVVRIRPQTRVLRLKPQQQQRPRLPIAPTTRPLFLCRNTPWRVLTLRSPQHRCGPLAGNLSSLPQCLHHIS
jgi:hypothetical protein